MSDYSRHEFAKRILMAAGAVLAAGPTSASAHEYDATAAVTTDDAAPSADGSHTETAALAPGEMLNAAAYVIGDRLKIAFFEKVDGSDEVGGGSQSELVERVELSGEYVVQDDGDIFLPIFGSVSIVGQTPRQLEQQLATLFKSTLGRNGKASIVLADREPIYIVGAITKQGTHRYTPGMTVMHAIALSEGLGDSYADFSRAAELIRERERLNKSIRHLQLLLARRSALLGEREKKEAEIPERLAGIVGKDNAAALVAIFVTERKLAFAAREARRMALQSTIDAARNEIVLLRTRLTHVEESIKNRTARFDTVAAMRTRGTFSDHALYQVRGELSDVLEREDTVKAGLAQTEEKLAQAQHEIAKIEAETQMEQYRELQEIESGIDEEDLVLLSSARLIRAAGNNAQSLPPTLQDLSFVIVRRTSTGPKRLPATTMTMLQAGDLLEIKRKAPAATVERAQIPAASVRWRDMR